MLLCLIVLIVLHLVTPFWWWIMVVPFVYALSRGKSGWDGFLAGAGSAGLLWLAAALVLSLTSAQFVAPRVATMFNLGGAAWAVVLVTGLVAALAAGAAGSAGFFVRAAVRG